MKTNTCVLSLVPFSSFLFKLRSCLFQKFVTNNFSHWIEQLNNWIYFLFLSFPIFLYYIARSYFYYAA